MTKTLPVALALCSLCVGALAGCRRGADEPATATSATATTVPQNDEPSEASGASAAPDEGAATEATPQVRKAVREYIAERFPSSEVDGVWSVALRSNYCFAAADTTSGSRRRVVEVLVRLYVREDGSQYWRAEGLYPDSAAARFLPRSLGNSLGNNSGEDATPDEEG